MSDNFEELNSRAEREMREQSKLLFREFIDHYKSLAAKTPDEHISKHEVFETWAIQQIAGLQKTVEYLALMLQDVQTNCLICDQPGKN